MKNLSRVVRARMAPNGTKSLEDGLAVRFGHLRPDAFRQFIEMLQADDDYPSIFRRLEPFPMPVPESNHNFINLMKRVFCHFKSIFCLAIDPLSRILVSGADDFSIKVWSLPDLDPVCIFSGHTNVISNCCINLNATMLLSSSHDGTVRLWDLVHGRPISVLSDSIQSIMRFFLRQDL